MPRAPATRWPSRARRRYRSVRPLLLGPGRRPAHRLLGDGEGRPVLLQPDVGVALLAQAHEVAVVDPLWLEELHGGHRLGADEGEVQPTRGLVVLDGDRVGVVGRPEDGAAPDDAV